MTIEPDVTCYGGGDGDPETDWSEEARKTPKEFSGVIDVTVVDDLHQLFEKKAKARELLMLLLGIACLPLLAWNIKVALDYPLQWIDALQSALFVAIFFSGWWVLAKGWAVKLAGLVVTGKVRAAGIVVDQLHGRAAWNEFHSAWMSNSAVILFQAEHERTPRLLAFDGLPLHRSFFASEEDWQDVRQLIRETIPKVRLVGRG